MARGSKRNTRQRMINLMYLVFIAMLAINYPEEVLDGFDLINEKLQAALENSEKRNGQIYTELDNSYAVAPDKTANAYTMSHSVKAKSDSIFNYIQSLKLEIAQRTDGKEADVLNIEGKDNLDASSVVMLGPSGQGKILRRAIEDYKEQIVSLIDDSAKQEIIRTSLSTTVSKKRSIDKKNWEESSFESMPTIATITYLTELQSNIRQAEGEVLSTIIKEIDIADLRMNKIEAYVIPQSSIVMRGGTYDARIILAAEDTTQNYKIFVDNKELPSTGDGKYSRVATTLGRQKVSGFISLMSRDGSEIKRRFEEEFTVIEPMVTIAPLQMDVLYANYANPLSVSVPGVVNQNISVSATGGSIKAEGNTWVATPSKVGQNMDIHVTVRQEGGKTLSLKKTFRVRRLPDPVAYIEYADAEGNQKTFKRGVLSKSALLNARVLKASIDDGVLSVPFTVLGFKTFSLDAMGNMVPEVAQGASFTDRQVEQIKRLPRGKSFFIASITVQDKDGSTREIAPMEMRLN